MTIDALKIPILYIIVSFISSCVNIGTQAATIWIYQGEYAISLSVLFGTLVGSPVKFILEKFLVFNFNADDFGHDVHLFVVFSLMGFLSTTVFWGVEWVFQVVFETDAMRYLGGAIGLTVGSFIKYHLDKRFVFKQEAA